MRDCWRGMGNLPFRELLLIGDRCRQAMIGLSRLRGARATRIYSLRLPLMERLAFIRSRPRIVQRRQQRTPILVAPCKTPSGPPRMTLSLNWRSLPVRRKARPPCRSSNPPSGCAGLYLLYLASVVSWLLPLISHPPREGIKARWFICRLSSVKPTSFLARRN